MPALKIGTPHRNAAEYADRVNLLKKIKIGEEWRLAPVIAESNGRLKGKVRVDGQVKVHAEGSYYIEWWASGRRFCEATTREDAVECARLKPAGLRAICAGLIATPEPPPAAPHKTPIGDATKGDWPSYVDTRSRKGALAMSMQPIGTAEYRCPWSQTR